MTDLNTQYEYTTEIKELAESIVETAYNEYDEVTDQESAEELINDTLLHETIDGHQWVIYCAYNDDVLKYSDNDEAYQDCYGNEDLGALVAEKGIDGVKPMMAFFAMYQDVQDQLNDALVAYSDRHEAA